jgi:hypothetical protein
MLTSAPSPSPRILARDRPGGVRFPVKYLPGLFVTILARTRGNELMARAILVAAVMVVVCAVLWAAKAANWLSCHLRFAAGARPTRQA